MLSPIAYPNKPALKNTNPIFINKLGKVLNKFYNEKFNINLMNKNNTKSEMLASTIASIPYQITNSCFTTRGISNMCGICYNCFLRNLSLMSINIFENYYEYDPFTDVINKTDAYDERQRILYHILRFYYEILINDKDAMQEVEISSKGYFDNPIEIANRFGSDIFLGIKNYFEFYEPTNLNALGKKADELLTMIEPEILDKRQQKLSEIAEDI
jgi:hypothetical protein